MEQDDEVLDGSSNGEKAFIPRTRAHSAVNGGKGRKGSASKKGSKPDPNAMEIDSLATSFAKLTAQSHKQYQPRGSRGRGSRIAL